MNFNKKYLNDYNSRVLNNYFLVAKELQVNILGIKTLNNNFNNFRFRLKHKYILYRKLDNLFVDVLERLKYIPRQAKELFSNRSYMEYQMKKFFNYF